MKKTFRGQLADATQKTIRLSTNNGLTGYKIVKLQIMIVQLGNADAEHVVQVFSTKRTSAIPTSNVLLELFCNCLIFVKTPT
jgi:dimeric dUTPase (all-alpha-NTP-PPase superfamily)